MPRACADVFRFFPSSGVLQQEMIAAPPAEVAAEVVFVRDGMSVAGVEPHRREIESPAGNFLRIISSRRRRLPDASARNSRFARKVVRCPQHKFFSEHLGPSCPSLVIIRCFTKVIGDFHAVLQGMRSAHGLHMRHHVDSRHRSVCLLACAVQQHRQHRVPFRIVVNSRIGRNVILNFLMRTAAAKYEACYKGAAKDDFHGRLCLKIVHQPLRFPSMRSQVIDLCSQYGRAEIMQRIFGIMKDLLRRRYALAGISLLFLCSFATAAQDAKNPDANLEDALITKLFPLTYPPLARQTRITGNVELKLELRSDGNVVSEVAVSGHPLLKKAALDNAQQSQFACKDCAEGMRSYRLVYTFELGPTSYCTDKAEDSSSSPEQSYPRLTQSPGHVTIVDQPVGTCDPATTITYKKVRSAKCLYLWRCAKPRLIILE